MTLYVIQQNKSELVPGYNPFLVYCRELAPGTVSLTGDRAQGDDSKHDSHYNLSWGLKSLVFPFQFTYSL